MQDTANTTDKSTRNGFQSNQDSTTPNPIEIRLDEIEGFDWTDDFERILTSLARTGLPPPSSPPWPTILQALLYSLKRTVESYFKLGSGSLFDTREEPAGGWLWTSEDLQKSIDRVYLALNHFSHDQPMTDGSNSPPLEQREQIYSIQSAPFTIQRLVELMFPQSPTGIHPHYTTLPKYLRAIQRVLSVSSPVISYAVNTFVLSHPNDFNAPQTHPSTSSSHHVNGANTFPIPPTTSTRPSRRHSTSTPITPILSPIPWLVNSERHDSLSPELASSDGRHSRHPSPLLLSSGSDERPITPPLMSASPPSIFTTTPPHTSTPSPRRDSFVVSPTPIRRTTTSLDLSSHVNILTDSPSDNQQPTETTSIDHTPTSNGVVSNLHTEPQPPLLITTTNQSEDTTMIENA